jgi:hypothetical protein
MNALTVCTEIGLFLGVIYLVYNFAMIWMGERKG